jgi:hypothetical protein
MGSLLRIRSSHVRPFGVAKLIGYGSPRMTSVLDNPYARGVVEKGIHGQR